MDGKSRMDLFIELVIAKFCFCFLGWSRVDKLSKGSSTASVHHFFLAWSSQTDWQTDKWSEGFPFLYHFTQKCRLDLRALVQNGSASLEPVPIISKKVARRWSWRSFLCWAGCADRVRCLLTISVVQFQFCSSDFGSRAVVSWSYLQLLISVWRIHGWWQEWFWHYSNTPFF